MKSPLVLVVPLSLTAMSVSQALAQDDENSNEAQSTVSNGPQVELIEVTSQ